MVVYQNEQNEHRGSKSSLTIVLKVGTSSICDEKTHYPLLGNLSRIVETILHLKSLKHRVVLVSSAAVGTGLRRLDMQERPKHQASVQAIAAVGQGRLMSLYDDLFGRFNQTVAQILLTKNDLADRTQYINAVNCLQVLLDMDVVPIVNENDTISYSGIKFGDNDTLSAIVAGMVKADYLFLMTDVDCLYTDNPRTNPNAQPVVVCDDIENLRASIRVGSSGSSLGTGGMMTKLVAADLATSAGVTTIITRAHPENVWPIIEAEAEPEKAPRHTRFLPKVQPLVDRKWWILYGLHTAGTLVVNQNLGKRILQQHHQAYPALPLPRAAVEDILSEDLASSTCSDTSSVSSHASIDIAKQTINGFALMTDAITRAEGHFVENQAVRVVMEKQDQLVTVAKGIVNYSSAEINRMVYAKSKRLMTTFGYNDEECVISKENLVTTF
ncbi:Aspartate/glutamate/uridylate kinase [Gongronella butleri]|nr:Aspartate/glutamate/uridylate kinase [Gongronella butleri]